MLGVVTMGGDYMEIAHVHKGKEGGPSLHLSRKPGSRAYLVVAAFAAAAAVQAAAWQSRTVLVRAIVGALLLWVSYLFFEDTQDVIITEKTIKLKRTSLHHSVHRGMAHIPMLGSILRTLLPVPQPRLNVYSSPGVWVVLRHAPV